MSKKRLSIPFKSTALKAFSGVLSLILLASGPIFAQTQTTGVENVARQRISINNNWSFYKYASADKADNLIYDVRPEATEDTDHKVAAATPTEAVGVAATQQVLKP